MLIEIWIILAITSITTLVLGILFAKLKDVASGKLVILMLSFIFQITTAISSFNIEKIGFTNGTAVTATIMSTEMVALFFAMSLFTIVLMFFYTFETIKP